MYILTLMPFFFLVAPELTVILGTSQSWGESVSTATLIKPDL